jgi:hypothetical protein
LLFLGTDQHRKKYLNTCGRGQLLAENSSALFPLAMDCGWYNSLCLRCSGVEEVAYQQSISLDRFAFAEKTSLGGLANQQVALQLAKSLDAQDDLLPLNHLHTSPCSLGLFSSPNSQLTTPEIDRFLFSPDLTKIKPLCDLL